MDIKKANDALIISRNDGENPVLWRCDLSAAQMATFSLKKLKTKTNLVMQPETGKAVTVIDFKDHSDALNAFQKITDVLVMDEEPAVIAPSIVEKKEDTDSKLSWFQSFVIFAAFFVILYIAYGTFFSSDRDAINFVPQTQIQTSDVPLIDVEKVMTLDTLEKGVPVALDNLLLPENRDR